MLEEINLVCMSGQGSVQAVELLAKAYFTQHGLFVASQVFPGPRARSAPVVCYLKVSDRPINSISANYHPSAVVVFWDGLLHVAAHNGHATVVDAIGRMLSGLFLVNTVLRPQELRLPFAFTGTLALVDAEGIAKKHLKRQNPPLGTALMGAYAAVTGKLDLDLLEKLMRERFPGENGRRNAAAAREAASAVEVLHGFDSGVDRAVPEPPSIDPRLLPEHYPLGRESMRGLSEGGASIWRSGIPVCDDRRCRCDSMCLSEVVCPDNTGFITRWTSPDGTKHQGYRIDTDFCRGCALCVEVCPHSALKMVPERELLATNPSYEGMSVAPFLGGSR